MHRATPFDSSFRGYVAGGSRSVVHEVDDKKEMQEGKGNFMKGETSDGIESPQNYGFTSVTMDGDKDKDGNITDGPETFTSYMGGNRSFPVNGNIDDRRHRLKGLEKGDVAMFRTKDDNQQFHMTTDGGFWSAPTDKTVRMQLVKKQDQQQGGQQGGGGAGAGTLAAGGGGGNQQGGQQDDGMSKRGQKAVRKNSSHQYVDVTDEKTNVSGTNTYLRLQDGNGYVHCSPDKNVWIGAEKGKAPFQKILTLAGPSIDSYAALARPSMLVAADPRYPTEIEPPPPDSTPPPDEFPFPEDPARCFYTETSWFDAHVADFNAHSAADAWGNFAGTPGASTPPNYTYPGVPLYQPFKFLRSEAAGETPGAALGKGMLGLNVADSKLFWLDAIGALKAASLGDIASVPGLLALMQVIKVSPLQAGGTYTFDTRTKHALIFLWGGSAAFNNGVAGSTGGAGGNSTFMGLTANGGTGNSISGDGVDHTSGQDGGGAGGLVIVGGGPSGGGPSGGGAGRGGLVIGFVAVTPGSSAALTIGGGGGATSGFIAGNPGGALIFEMT